ncbi:MAG: hypothetical protein ACJ797_19960 [Ktedonobacteraceae bacterium]
MYRFIQNWPKSISKAPPSPKRWYVAVIGHPPPEPLLTKVTESINTGEPVPLPDAVVSEMAAKRLTEISKRPYTEIRQTFTVRRKTKEKKKPRKRWHSRR